MLVENRVNHWLATLLLVSMMDELEPIDKSLAGLNAYRVLCLMIIPVFLPSMLI